MYTHKIHMLWPMYERSEDNSMVPVFSFHLFEGSRDWTVVVRWECSLSWNIVFNLSRCPANLWLCSLPTETVRPQIDEVLSWCIYNNLLFSKSKIHMDTKKDLPAEKSKVYIHIHTYIQIHFWEAGDYCKWVFIGGRKLLIFWKAMCDLYFTINFLCYCLLIRYYFCWNFK